MVQEKGINVGIDIGTTKVCCIIAQNNEKNDGLKLIGAGICGSTGMKKGVVTNMEEVVHSVETAVQHAEKMANVNVKSAYVGISGEHIRGINTQGAIAISKNGHQLTQVNEITNSDISKVLEMAKAISLPLDREIYHILPQEYIVDDQRGIKDPLGMVGRRLEAQVHLVTGSTSAGKNISKCVEELGIQVLGLIFQPLSSASSTMEDHEKELGSILIDLGGGTTDISVFFEGAVRHSGVINLGSNTITNDIAMMLQISLEEAEDIKLKYGSAKASMASTDLDFELPHGPMEVVRRISEHELSRYVEARLTEIFQMVKTEVMRADVKNTSSFNVILTGGGSQLKNIASLAVELLGGPVKIGIPKGIGGVVDIAASPIYASAIGLILYSGTVAKDFNLGDEEKHAFNQVFKRVKNWFGELL